MMPEGGSAAATVLRSDDVDWSVTECKSKYADYFEVRRFNAMFSDGRKSIVYDRRAVKRDTDTGGCFSRRQVLLSFCSGYVDPIGSIDMPMVHEDVSYYVLCLATLVEHAEIVRGLKSSRTCSLDRP